MDKSEEATQKAYPRDVPGAEGLPDKQEKEQKELICSLLCTIHHFFGAFPPSVLQCC